jgi:hypothetical protein
MQIECAVRLILERPRARADDHGVARGLVDDEMVFLAGDHLLASAEVRHHRDEVAHGPGRDEEAGVLAEKVGGAFLERNDRGVIAEHVVAHLGVCHRSTHRIRRACDGVAAQVDRSVWHGRRV